MERFFNDITAVLMSKLKLLSSNMEAKHCIVGATDSLETNSEVYITVQRCHRAHFKAANSTEVIVVFFFHFSLGNSEVNIDV